jgi:hypothetical protein
VRGVGCAGCTWERGDGWWDSVSGWGEVGGGGGGGGGGGAEEA